MPKVKTETQPPRSLPRNSNPKRSMILARIGGQPVSEVVLDDQAVSLIRFEDAEPIRKFYAWPHRRVYDGLYWSSTTRTHVEFESLLEREFLMKSDFDTEVADISAQPLAILWPYRKQGPRHHVPDYFVRLADGSGRLVDVRRPDKARDNEQFEMTRSLCSRIGWDYEVFTGLSGQREANLRFMAGFRADRYQPEQSLIPVIQDCYSPATSFEAGLLRAVRVTKLAKEQVHGHVLWMIFHSLLLLDLDAAISMETQVRNPREVTA